MNIVRSPYWKPLSQVLGSVPTFFGMATKQQLLPGYASEIQCLYSCGGKFSMMLEFDDNSAADPQVGENEKLVR